MDNKSREALELDTQGMKYPELKRLIEEQPMTGLQLVVIAICFLLNILDGMDVLVISYSAPLIMQEWGADAGQFGMVFSATLLGMTLGAMLVSPRADHIGRRNMVLINATVIAAGMIATAQAQSIVSLIGLRFLTGIGIGSMLASLTSLAAEYSSNIRRNLVVGAVLAGYPIGAILAGALAGCLLPDPGWRALFLAAGIISAAMIPLIYFMLPESLEFLAKRRPPKALATLNSILGRMHYPALQTLPDLSGEMLLKTSVFTLFQGERRRCSQWLWVAFFMSFLSMYFLLSWVPKLVLNAGLGLGNAIYAGALFNLGAFFGITLLGYFSNRFGLRRLIVLFFGLAVCFMLLFGWTSAPVKILLAETFLLGFFLQGAFVGLYAIAARIYPMEIRTTGIGWGIGAGRVGAIIGPYLGGLTIAAGWSNAANFTLFAIPCLVAALATVFIAAKDLD